MSAGFFRVHEIDTKWNRSCTRSRPVAREPLVRAGIVAFTFALAVPFVGTSRDAAPRPVTVASAFEAESFQGIARAPQRVRDLAQSEVVAGVEVGPAATSDPSPDPTPEPTIAPTPQPAPKTAAPQIVLPSLAPPATGGLVVASWYGPGFYGNRTACGQTYSPAIFGVAHRTLPCGTLVTLTHGARTVTVPVIDRGPYVAGRSLDLSYATKLALGCPDLCTLSMRVGQ
jgi:rare lipoprotein A (peptidoglycan hydrolase)